MTKPSHTRRSFLTAMAGLGAATLAAPAVASTLSRPDVIIGWTPWTDAEVITKLTARVLRDHAGLDVELTLADIGAQFRTVASGEIDLMMMSWEPGLHKDYLRKHTGKLEDLGTLYQGTIGLAVPAWVPSEMISSIDDLKKPEVMDALGKEIVGIDPGAGLMATTRSAMQQYDLAAYSLSEGTGPKMQRAVAKAERKQKPVVVTAWRPHMKFELYGMRYLEDPKGVFAEASEIHARASSGFVKRAPEVAELIRRIHLEATQIEKVMTRGREVGVDDAVSEWIDQNKPTIQSWIG